MAQLSFVILSERPALRARLEATGHAEIKAFLSEPGALQEVVRRFRPDVLFVDLEPDPTGLLDELEMLAAPRPILLVSGPQDESRLILRAMRLGAREFFPPRPSEDALRSAVERLLLEHEPKAEAAQATAPVIGVMGAKGGVGATFLACQLAAELQRLGGRTALVDMNLRVGDVALFFDLHPRYTLANLASERDVLDPAFLHSVLEPHPCGVQVLSAPARAEEAELVQVHHVEGAVDVLRGEFDWVILDVSRSWDETSVRALDRADEIFLVTLLDVPTLNHARQHLDLLQRLGHPLDKIRLIANRYSRSGPVSDSDFAEFLERRPDASIPNDYPTTVACVNEGKPLWETAPGSELRTGITRLAEQAHLWCGRERPKSERGSGLGSRLRGYLRKNRNPAN